nr:RecName: Full=Conotoxin Ca15a [Conus caracteristicus]
CRVENKCPHTVCCDRSRCSCKLIRTRPLMYHVCVC